jgi:glutamate carboxypeptidase
MSVSAQFTAWSSRGPELRDRLVAWANVNSGSDHLAGLERMRGMLRDEFSRTLHATAEEPALAGTAARALRLRVRPSAPRQLLLSGHYDTVYGADHPFQQCTLLDAHTLRGPGVVDMKGGLVVMLAALEAFEQSPEAAGVGWEALLSPDEEIGSAGTAPLLEEAASRHQLALIFEPARANGNLVRARMGTGIFTATCHGRAAHAGRDPGAGRNAIVALAEFLPAASRLTLEMPGVLLNIGAIRGGGAVNIVPDFAAADINLRVTREADAAEVLRRLREIAAPINAREGYRLEITGRFNRPPKGVTPAEERLFAAWQACGAELGSVFSWQDVGGGSDGNLLGAAGLPCLDGLGPVGDGLHSPEETVQLASLAERAQIAALFLHRVANGQIELPMRAHRH